MANSKPKKRNGIDERWLILLIGIMVGGALMYILPQLALDFFGESNVGACSTEYQNFEFTVPAEASMDTGNLAGVPGEFFATNCLLENGMQDILFQREADTGKDIRCMRYKETIPIGKADGAFQNRCYNDIIVTIKCKEEC